MKDNLQSQTIENLRFPLLIAVLMCHSYNVTLSGVTLDTDSTFGGSFVRCLFNICNYTMPNIVVPSYFFISGFLFFLNFGDPQSPKQWKWNIYWGKLRTRFYTLFIPYVIWNLIPLVLGVLGVIIITIENDQDVLISTREFMQGKGLRIFWDFYREDDTKNYLGMMMPGNTAPYNYPLYYIRDLIGISILAPIVYIFDKKAKWWGITILVCCSVMGLIPNYPGLRSSSIVYFTLGACLSIWNLDFHRVSLLVLPWSGLLSLVFLVAALFYPIQNQYAGFIKGLFVLSGVFALFGIIAWLTEKCKLNISKWLIGSSFFVFAAHEGLFVMNGVKVLLKSIIPQSSGWFLFAEYWLNIFLTLSCCVAIYLIIDKWVPSLSILTGKVRRPQRGH